jgi:hypothetical protein
MPCSTDKYIGSTIVSIATTPFQTTLVFTQNVTFTTSYPVVSTQIQTFTTSYPVTITQTSTAPGGLDSIPDSLA